MCEINSTLNTDLCTDIHINKRLYEKSQKTQEKRQLMSQHKKLSSLSHIFTREIKGVSKRDATHPAKIQS
jgi:hypothetical protein